MTLTDHQQSQLVAADRALSHDPVLCAIADLFPFPTTDRIRRRAVWSAHRLLLVMRWSPAAMAAGLATTALTAALASPAVAVGLTVLIGAAVVFVVAAIRRSLTVPAMG